MNFIFTKNGIFKWFHGGSHGRFFYQSPRCYQNEATTAGGIESERQTRNTLQKYVARCLLDRENGRNCSPSKGLVPALWFQVFLNGIRLGSFGIMEKWNWTKNKNNEVSVVKTAVLSAAAGSFGSFVGSPFYLIKTHLQSQAASQIAVGYQHDHTKTFPALFKIYKTQGVKGLWRGSVSAIPRVAVGSGVQLSTFSITNQFLEKNKILTKEKSLWNTFFASMACGVFVALAMSPFDVVQTRMYNQGLDKNGKPLLYTGIIDCFYKMLKTEGILGFFKGFGPCYLRIGPHSVLTLVFWSSINKFFQR